MKKIQPPVPRNLPGIVHWSALLMMLMFSAPLFSQEEPEAPESAEEKSAPAITRPMISTGVDAEAIARKRPDTAVWLTDRKQDRVLALFQPEQESPAKGALVILSDEGVSAAAGLADALRGPLSQDGWAVMTLGLQAPPFAVQRWLRQQSNAQPDVAEKPTEEPAKEKVDDGQSSVMINLIDTETPNDALKQYRDQVVSSLTAAIDALSEQEYQRIVLAGVGRAAGHVTRQAREDGRASDLIWIAPHFYPDESSGLAGLLASAVSPSILELYSTFPGDKTLDRSARERAAALERAGISGYRRQPAAMARQPQPREARMLANRISAWLRSTSKTR